MFEESEAVIQTILALQRSDIPSPLVHDSIIVPENDASEAQFVDKCLRTSVWCSLQARHKQIEPDYLIKTIIYIK